MFELFFSFECLFRYVAVDSNVCRHVFEFIIYDYRRGLSSTMISFFLSSIFSSLMFLLELLTLLFEFYITFAFSQAIDHFLSFWSFLFKIILLGYVIAISAAARHSKPTKDPFSDFAGEPDLNLITDDDDKPPTQFVGDVMHAKITALKNSNHGKGKFNFKLVWNEWMSSFDLCNMSMTFFHFFFNSFATQNGINIAQIGKLKDDKTFVVTGSYSYTGETWLSRFIEDVCFICIFFRCWW